MEFRFRDVNEAFYRLVSGISSGSIPTKKSTSRNGDVLHIPEPVMITYDRPRQRVLFNIARDCNPFFHLFESLWMLAGHDDVEPLAYYASNMTNFSDDKRTLNGAYGYRWRSKMRHVTGSQPVYDDWIATDQLSILVSHLHNVPDSRRAVLSMWNVEDDLLKIGGNVVGATTGGFNPNADGPKAGVILGKGSKDVCCNLCVCFSLSVAEEIKTIGGVRPGYESWPEHPINCRLDMTVFNRSNDLIWGTLGANVVHFSMLQEYMACCLGVEVGVYHQISNNQHVYLNNFKPDEWLKGTPCSSDYVLPTYPKSDLLLVEDKNQFDEEVKTFVETYWGHARAGMYREYKEPFLRNVARPMCLAFSAHKNYRDYASAFRYLSMVRAADWRAAGVAWIGKRDVAYRNKQKETV